MSKDYKRSKAGQYRVEISRVHQPRGYRYRPGLIHTIDQATLDVWLEQDGLVLSIVPV